MLFYWLIYGNYLFFSKMNDCADKSEFKDLVWFMRVALFMGYLFMVYYILLITIVTFVIYLIVHD